MIFRRRNRPQPPFPPFPPATPAAPAAPRPTFDVRRLPPEAQPDWSPPAPAPTPAPTTLAIRYPRAADALTLIGLLARLGAVHFGVCQRNPRDRAVWVTLDPGGELERELALATGGHPVPAPAGMAAWDPVPLPLLAAEVAPSARVGDQTEVVVVTNGPLARSLVRQCIDDALPVTITPIELRPVGGPETTRPAVALRLHAPDRALPSRTLLAIAALPDTVVCRATEPRLLLDFRAVLPVSDQELATGVPPDERWVVGAGFGAWRLRSLGEEVRPAVGLPAPLAAPAAAAPHPLPERVGVTIRLHRSARVTARVDAVLIGDEELGALRTFLSHGPGGDELVLLLGPGRHLLTEPGGLTRPVPFGTPLTRYGRDGLYLPAGHLLRPRPPDDALVVHFGLARGSVVVVTEAESCRFSVDHLVPAWSLWLGPPPTVREGLSSAATAVLHQLSEVDLPAPAAGEPTPASFGAPKHEPAERGELVREAVRLEQAGEFALAARQLELAGDFYRAARMYELAAGRGRTEDGKSG